MRSPEQIREILRRHALGESITNAERKAINRLRNKQRAAKGEQPARTRQTLKPHPVVFASMKAMAAATGIPMPTLQKAKRDGCPAFHQSNRVNFHEFVRWYFTARTGSDVDQKERLTRVQADLYETKNRLAVIDEDVRAGRLVDMVEVDKHLKRLYEPVVQQIKTLATRLDTRVNPADPEHAHKVLEEETRSLLRTALKSDGR